MTSIEIADSWRPGRLLGNRLSEWHLRKKKNPDGGSVCRLWTFPERFAGREVGDCELCRSVRRRSWADDNPPGSFPTAIDG